VEVAVSAQFQIDPLTAATVVVTTVGIYVAFMAMVRVVGPRSLTGMSSFDFACVVALGAVVGRTSLLAVPTLAIGVVALATFFGMQAALGLLRQNPRIDRLLNPAPRLLALDGALLPDNMRRAHIVEDEVRQALRRAGAGSLDEVACIVLERNGALSVIRRVGRVDPWLLRDVARTSAEE
jgi:uncharacterized membrane protein YcaP (DUF421 family)